MVQYNIYMDQLVGRKKSSSTWRIIRLDRLAGGELGRPMLVTPGTAPERIKNLRFYRDPLCEALPTRTVAEPRRRKMDVDPSSAMNWKIG